MNFNMNWNLLKKTSIGFKRSLDQIRRQKNLGHTNHRNGIRRTWSWCCNGRIEASHWIHDMELFIASKLLFYMKVEKCDTSNVEKILNDLEEKIEMWLIPFCFIYFVLGYWSHRQLCRQVVVHVWWKNQRSNRFSWTKRTSNIRYVLRSFFFEKKSI